MSAFSFHETKNIISGEGGMLAINDERFIERSEIIWEKGTNRSAFFRGEVDKYGCVDVGSSFLPSEIIAAFLWAQLENLNDIQSRRKEIWEIYYTALKEWAKANEVSLPKIPDYATNNAHMFYLVFKKAEQRAKFIEKMRDHHILCVFHYLSLHKSEFYRGKHDGRLLKKSADFLEKPVSDCMTEAPTTITIDKLAAEALNIMEGKEVNDLPAVKDGKPVGMLNFQDLLRAKVF
jgi:dTDP-4-amino-4,6-dideoxygalactose transaminase